MKRWRLLEKKQNREKKDRDMTFRLIYNNTNLVVKFMYKIFKL